MDTTKRLFRSDDAMIGGVCAGIAEYFDIDPTIVRIIVVVMVMLGLGFPIIAYLIAWVIMPRRPEGYTRYTDVKPTEEKREKPTTDISSETTENTSETKRSAEVSTTAPPEGSSASQAASTPPPPPNASERASCASFGYHNPGACYTASNSQTFDAVDPQAAIADGQDPEARSRHHRGKGAVVFGILLVCIGLVALLGTLVDISLWRLWPTVLLVAGAIMLFMPSKQGWSLERAGSAIILISIGVVLQAWVLGIVPVSTFFRLLVHLWPILLVILGLTILGSALKKSVFHLLGALLFSATLILGTWCYGQITGPVVLQVPTDHPIILDMPHSPDFAREQDAHSFFWIWR